MGEWQFRNYTPAFRNEWDAFVKDSRNATFLFMRGYMDYHSDRFRDASIMAYAGGRLMALLPANAGDDGTLCSHGGLTYGGWVVPVRHLDMPKYFSMWNSWLEFCRESGYREVIYTPVPSIYASQPSEEDRYMLFLSGAELHKCQISTAIDLRHNPGFNQQQRRHLKKASALGVSVSETDDVEAFIDLLTACLQSRHGCTPVHSAAELRLLKERFPENIRIFAVADGEGMQAGVCVYDTGRVAHAQYIASTDTGRERNMLSLLFDFLINSEFTGRVYFDFGISTEDGGRWLNEGLARQKCSYGGTGVVYDSYRIILK